MGPAVSVTALTVKPARPRSAAGPFAPTRHGQHDDVEGLGAWVGLLFCDDALGDEQRGAGRRGTADRAQDGYGLLVGST
jgi:hypothetical protein